MDSPSQRSWLRVVVVAAAEIPSLPAPNCLPGFFYDSASDDGADDFAPHRSAAGPEPELETPPMAAVPSLPTAAPAMPGPPPSHQLPSGVDMSNPGVAVKPLAATSSSAQGGNTAAKAFDGDPTSRWEECA